jgi:hypothetical protein
MPSNRVGQYSCAAMITPTSIPTMPQTTVITVNWRTTILVNDGGAAACRGGPAHSGTASAARTAAMNSGSGVAPRRALLASLRPSASSSTRALVWLNSPSAKAR